MAPPKVDQPGTTTYFPLPKLEQSQTTGVVKSNVETRTGFEEHVDRRQVSPTNTGDVPAGTGGTMRISPGGNGVAPANQLKLDGARWLNEAQNNAFSGPPAATRGSYGTESEGVGSLQAGLKAAGVFNNTIGQPPVALSTKQDWMFGNNTQQGYLAIRTELGSALGVSFDGKEPDGSPSYASVPDAAFAAGLQTYVERRNRGQIPANAKLDAFITASTAPGQIARETPVRPATVNAGGGTVTTTGQGSGAITTPPGGAQTPPPPGGQTAPPPPAAPPPGAPLYTATPEEATERPKSLAQLQVRTSGLNGDVQKFINDRLPVLNYKGIDAVTDIVSNSTFKNKPVEEQKALLIGAFKLDFDASVAALDPAVRARAEDQGAFIDNSENRSMDQAVRADIAQKTRAIITAPDFQRLPTEVQLAVLDREAIRGGIGQSLNKLYLSGALDRLPDAKDGKKAITGQAKKEMGTNLATLVNTDIGKLPPGAIRSDAVVKGCWSDALAGNVSEVINSKVFGAQENNVKRLLINGADSQFVRDNLARVGKFPSPPAVSDRARTLLTKLANNDPSLIKMTPTQRAEAALQLFDSTPEDAMGLTMLLTKRPNQAEHSPEALTALIRNYYDRVSFG